MVLRCADVGALIFRREAPLAACLMTFDSGLIQTKFKLGNPHFGHILKFTSSRFTRQAGQRRFGTNPLLFIMPLGSRRPPVKSRNLRAYKVYVRFRESGSSVMLIFGIDIIS